MRLTYPTTHRNAPNFNDGRLDDKLTSATPTTSRARKKTTIRDMETIKTTFGEVTINPTQEEIIVTLSAEAKHVCLKIVDAQTRNETTLAWNK